MLYIKYSGRCAASLVIACISINRFAVVVYPLKSGWFMKTSHAIIQIVASMVAALILNTFILFYPPINSLNTNGYFYGILVVEIIFSDVIVSLVIVVLSLLTTQVFIQSGHSLRRSTRSRSDSVTSSRWKDRQVTVLLLTVAFTYVVLRLQYKVVWIPIFYMQHISKSQISDSLKLAYYITNCIFLLNYATNLYQYCICSSLFRKEFVKIFTRTESMKSRSRKISTTSQKSQNSSTLKTHNISL